MNKKYKTIAAIESFTGGLFSSTIINKPGASKYFKGAIIAYWNEIKEKLEVDTSKGVVNKEVALEMALKGKKYFNVDFCVSFTGNAGPETIENKKIGNVFIAINNVVYELKIDSNNRNEIRKEAVNFAIRELEKITEQEY